MSADRRVLIVDDDIDFADSLRDSLEAENYQVEIAHNALDAVIVTEAFVPHVALLDIRLQFGQGDGLDLLATLKQKSPELLCIIMTAYADTETAIKALQGDAYDYLRKPLYFQELITTLNRCFEKIDLEQKNRQAMMALRASEERYRTLAEVAHDMIFIIGEQGLIEYVNEFAAHQFGLQPETIVGKKMVEMFPPEVAKRQQNSIDKALAAKASIYVEALSAFPAGERWLGTWLVPLRDKAGGISSVMGVSRDIHERKQAEDALQRSEEEYRSLFEFNKEILRQAPIGIIRMDTQMRIQYENPELERIIGLPNEETRSQAVGVDIRKLPGIQEAGLVSVFGDLQKGKDVAIETSFTSIYGKKTFLKASGCPIREGGRIVGSVLLVENVTERKRAEEGLKEYSERLEEMVEERTRELQNALEEAQTADQLKSEFIANVNHELRTPLTNLLLYYQMLSADPSVKTTERLDVIGRELQRLRNLIEDLLNLSRLDLKQVTFYPVPHNLNELIQSLVDDRRALAEERGLTLTAELCPDLPLIQLDEAMAVQAVSNLLTNALNYTPAGGKVHVRTMIVDDRDGKPGVGISVQDTGQGINQDDLPHIFKRFYRGRAGHETGAPGTGLGLAIVKEVIERHHGSVEVKNGADGRGAIFTIWLPVEHMQGMS